MDDETTRTATTTEVSDDFLGRMNQRLERITEATEHQLRLLDERISELHARGEDATERLVTSIEQGVRAQIDGLGEEIEQLRRRIGEIRGGAAGARGRKARPKAEAAAKKKAKKAGGKSSKQAAKKPAKSAKKAAKKATKKAKKKAATKR